MTIRRRIFRTMFAAALTLGFCAPSLAAGQAPNITDAMRTAVTACRDWVIKPGTWVDNIGGFPKAARIEGRIRPLADIPDVAKPPVPLRKGSHYWHVPAGVGGLYVTVSDVTPMCHIVGGGPEDWQPSVEWFLKTKYFLDKWEPVSEKTRDGMRTSQHVFDDEPKFSLVISRADGPGGRTDRAQVLMTGIFDISR